MEFLIALYDRIMGRFIPVQVRDVLRRSARSVRWSISSCSACCSANFGVGFVKSTIAATAIAMTFNFFVNNALTYRDGRLKGARALFDGWVSFCAVCSVGAVANVGVAAFLYDARSDTWIVSALGGDLVSAVWNYALSSRFVWGRY